MESLIKDSLIFLVFFALIFAERFFSIQRYAPVKGWYKRAIPLNLIQSTIVFIAGLTWNQWFQSMSIFSLSSFLSETNTQGFKLDLLTGITAYVIASFMFYWWHRLRHQSQLIWRIIHQVHHSPTRIETLTTLYVHPLEMIVNTLMSSVLIYIVLGLSVTSAAVYLVLSSWILFFIHSNIRTPRWIGLIVSRPEMHRIHHKRNHHRENFGDIVIWDMLFGTYNNPDYYVEKCGFGAEKELKIADMLKFKDVLKEEKSKSSTI